MEVAELVDAAGGLGGGKEVAGWVSPTGLQALHAPLGAALVRAPPQISMVIVGEVACRGAGRKEDKAVSTTELFYPLGFRRRMLLIFTRAHDVWFLEGWVKKSHIWPPSASLCAATGSTCPTLSPVCASNQSPRLARGGTGSTEGAM